jgi:RNA polymerase sigma-54 factor
MGPGMGMGLNMQTKLQQTMQLAPRMIQSMEILQLPVMALQERIQEELQTNPVLELSEEPGENAPAADEWTETQRDAADPRNELVIDPKKGDEDFDRLEAINQDWADHFNEEHRVSSNRIEEESDKKHLAESNMASRPQSLLDYLEDQLSLLECTPAQLRLARHVLTHMYSDGYLRRVEHVEQGDRVVQKVEPVSLEEIAASYDEPVTVADVEAALKLIQSLEPAGVGARDLRECLLLQLTPDMPHVEVMRVLIQNHLEDIQHNRLPVIQKKTGFDLPTIQEAIEQLKHLNPNPGGQFLDESTQYVVPDIAVEHNESGDYEVRLLDDWTPSVCINERYLRLYRDKRSDPSARDFLKRKIQAAQWLLEAIEQRRNTLMKVTRAIIAHQRAFLDHGPEMIEPLKMQQIADQVGVHVTTVSRAVDDKWVQTPRGIFPLKRFFGGGTRMKNADGVETGEEVAYEAIKQKLLELIDNENKSDPLSDEDLVKKLNEAGYPVARRTVTKYRKMLNIQSSRQRKVWT